MLAERPRERTVERGRSEIDGQKGDGVELQTEGGSRGFAKMGMIGFLDRGTCGDRKAGTNSADCFDAGRDKVERTFDAADGVVDCRRAVERNDDVVERGSHFLRVLRKKQSRGQKRGANALRAEERAELRKLRVHEGLAAGEHDPANAKTTDGRKLTLEFNGGEGSCVASLPDVAHDAAAVAGAVCINHEDGQGAERVRIFVARF